MQVKNKEYLVELKKRQEELEVYEVQVKKGQIDLKTYRDKILQVYELKYLDVAIREGANELVQYAIINLRSEEQQGLLTW